MLKNYDQKSDCRSYGNAFLYFLVFAFLNFFDVDIFIWYPLTLFKTLSLIDILFNAFFFLKVSSLSLYLFFYLSTD